MSDQQISRRYLFACNLQSNQVLSLAVDPDTGRLTRTASTNVPRAAVIDFAVL